MLGGTIGLPANAARLATDTATLPFCAESAIPFTNRTVAIAYSMRSVFSDAAARLTAASLTECRANAVSLTDTARVLTNIDSLHLVCHTRPCHGGDRTKDGAVVQEGDSAHLARVSSSAAEMSTPSGSRPRQRQAATCVGREMDFGMLRKGRDRGSGKPRQRGALCPGLSACRQRPPRTASP